MNVKNDYTAFTVCNVAYLNKALVLSDSYHIQTNKKLNIYLIDTKRELPNLKNHHKIIWIEELNLPELNNLAFKYDITELSTSLKPYLAKKNLELNQKVIFFDPDIFIYSSIDKILNDLNDCSILLTPHYTTPEPNEWDNSDVGMMRFGSFNLGFFALRDTLESGKFVDWWHDRCMRYCFFETQFGLSTDQKWISIAPCLFRDIKISFNSGYNMAFWNLHERLITKNEDKSITINNKERLIFFHFSSFDNNNPKLLSTRPVPAAKNINNYLQKLAIDYGNKLLKYKNKITDDFYGYDFMSNGDYISPTLRRAYVSAFSGIENKIDPFDSNGEVGVFAKKNYLIERKNNSFSPLGFQQKNDHSLKFKIINFFMRAILRFLGPNKFMNFSRLLVFLSSYRLNNKLWKT